MRYMYDALVEIYSKLVTLDIQPWFLFHGVNQFFFPSRYSLDQSRSSLSNPSQVITLHSAMIESFIFVFCPNSSPQSKSSYKMHTMTSGRTYTDSSFTSLCTLCILSSWITIYNNSIISRHFQLVSCQWWWQVCSITLKWITSQPFVSDKYSDMSLAILSLAITIFVLMRTEPIKYEPFFYLHKSAQCIPCLVVISGFMCSFCYTIGSV